MAKEIERKFLVADARWRDLVEEEILIRQFYVAAGAGRTIRIRISNGATAMLTLKFSGPGRGRDEFEYAIPLAEAEEMQGFRARACHRRRHAAMFIMAAISTRWTFSAANLPASSLPS